MRSASSHATHTHTHTHAYMPLLTHLLVDQSECLNQTYLFKACWISVWSVFHVGGGCFVQWLITYPLSSSIGQLAKFKDNSTNWVESTTSYSHVQHTHTCTYAVWTGAVCVDCVRTSHTPWPSYLQCFILPSQVWYIVLCCLYSLVCIAFCTYQVPDFSHQLEKKS